MKTRFLTKYIKEINQFVVRLYVTRHKSVAIIAQCYLPIHKDYGYLNLALNFNYRFRSADHAGFDINANLIFFEITFEFTDDRHSEDYERSSL